MPPRTPGRAAAIASTAASSRSMPGDAGARACRIAARSSACRSSAESAARPPRLRRDLLPAQARREPREHAIGDRVERREALRLVLRRGSPPTGRSASAASSSRAVSAQRAVRFGGDVRFHHPLHARALRRSRAAWRRSRSACVAPNRGAMIRGTPRRARPSARRSANPAHSASCPRIAGGVARARDGHAVARRGRRARGDELGLVASFRQHDPQPSAAGRNAA